MPKLSRSSSLKWIVFVILILYGFTSNPTIHQRTKIAREKAEREAAEKAAREKAKKEVTEKADREREEKEAAEKVAREKAEKEAADKAAKEKAEQDAAEKVAKEKAEKDAAEKAAREKAEKEAAEKATREKSKKEAAEKSAKETAEKAKAIREDFPKREKRQVKTEYVVVMVGVIVIIIVSVLFSLGQSNYAKTTDIPVGIPTYTTTPTIIQTSQPTQTLTPSPTKTMSSTKTPTKTLKPSATPPEEIVATNACGVTIYVFDGSGSYGVKGIGYVEPNETFTLTGSFSRNWLPRGSEGTYGGIRLESTGPFHGVAEGQIGWVFVTESGTRCIKIIQGTNTLVLDTNALHLEIAITETPIP